MSNDQIYVITGATGWIGRECLEYLITNGVPKENIYLFASRQQTLDMPFGSFAVASLDEMADYVFKSPMVFHFAYLTRDKVNILGRQVYTDTCLSITSMMMTALKSWPHATLCYASSGAVYDGQFKRDYYIKNPYGFLKYMDECSFKEFCHAGGNRIIIPRIFNISGCYTQNRSQYALTSFIDQAKETGVIHIKAKHKVIRSYIMARQLIDICFKWMHDQKGSSFECFDACSDEAVEIGQIAESVQRSCSHVVHIKREIDDSLESDVYLGNAGAIFDLCVKYIVALLPLDLQIKSLINDF
jgi:nucleoside-diphosphate-sugar epimerase